MKVPEIEELETISIEQTSASIDLTLWGDAELRLAITTPYGLTKLIITEEEAVKLAYHLTHLALKMRIKKIKKTKQNETNK
jgi:hypothetical protein